ncbi:MAG: cell division protein FtsA [Ostreibacterium sp.]
MKETPIVAVIDIGTSCIIAALAKISSEGDIVPIALAEVPSKGMKKGGVVNIPLVQHAIDIVLDALQVEGNYHIHSIITSLSGVSVIGHNADGNVAIRGNPITEHNIQQAVACARDMSMLEGRQLLHILRQSFIVDKQTNIENPIGLMGGTLSVRVHVISSAKMAYYNLLQIFSHRDVGIEQVVAAGYASAIAVTSSDEKQLGVCVLDIGAGTTDISIINQGVVKHTEVIPMGGELITDDMAFFMRTTVETAEVVKKEISIEGYYLPDDMIEVQGLSEVARRFARYDLADVISKRYEQMIEIILQKLSRAGVEDIFPGGFVICGGGAEQLGLSVFLMKYTQLPVRRAEIEIPLKNSVKKGSQFATLMGLFMCAYEEDFTRTMTGKAKTGIISQLSGVFSNLIGRLRKQF